MSQRFVKAIISNTGAGGRSVGPGGYVYYSSSIVVVVMCGDGNKQRRRVTKSYTSLDETV